VCDRLIATLADVRHLDSEIARDLDRLRRTLVRHRSAGAPWLAQEALETIAILDTPAWAALCGLLSECPVLPEVAAAMLAGRRPRPSFAPMVIATGTLMAFEALKVLLGRPSGVDHRGVFLDPWAMRVERPRPAPVAWVMGKVAGRMLRRLAVAAG
jgi:hypothetical protein